jgi:DAACS family dicarboxylate/amino acid:cation (Na+ or H+) symporter
LKLESRIFVGLAAGVAVGLVSKIAGAEWLQHGLIALEPIGTVFIRLVTMVVIPLVVAGLFAAVASLGDVRTLGRVGGRTLVFFLTTTVLGATIGLVVAMAARVGNGLDAATRDALTVRFETQGATAVDAAAKSPSFVQTLVDMVPQNPVAAAARGDLLPLIVAVCLFAAAATVIDTEGKRALVSFCRGVNDVSMVVIRWLMHLAPPAVFVLIAATVARSGADLLLSLLGYAVVVVVAILAHLGLVLIPALRFGARIGVVHFFRSVSDALVMAFSTASSNATLPVSMNAARTRLGLPDNVVSFVLPAGATLNKNGAAVYKAATAVFIAQLYGLPLGPATWITIIATSTIAAFAGAGVPGSSLVTTLIVLNAIGLGPHAAAAIALVAGIDRPLDMFRTTLNTTGNLVGTAVIGIRELTADLRE